MVIAYFFHCSRSGDLVVQVIEEYGHQQHMGSSSAQETVRGELVWQLGSWTVTVSLMKSSHCLAITSPQFGSTSMLLVKDICCGCWSDANISSGCSVLLRHWHDLHLFWSLFSKRWNGAGPAATPRLHPYFYVFCFKTEMISVHRSVLA